MDRYGDYKDSGIDWIGEIPSDWDCGKVKRSYRTALGKMLSQKQTSESSLNLPYLCAANIKETGFNLDTIKEMTFEEDEIETYSVETGDLLVVEGGNVGAAQIWEGPRICIQNSLHRVRTSDNSSLGYLKYWLAHAKASGQIDLICNKATIAHFTKDKLMNCNMVYPPKKTQAAIATFLDNKVKLIDSIVEEASKTIVLLHEYRQSIITEAVTRGLDPNSPTKPSGIEWVGNIPANWNTSRGKAIFAEKDIRSETGEEELLTVSHITGVTPRSAKNVNMFMAESLVGYKVCEVGDIAANTMWLWQGAIGVAPTRGVISYSYSVYRQLNNAYDDHFLDYLLRSNAMVSAYCANSTGITKSRLRLYPDKFLTLKWPIPPMSEQKSIAAYLDTKTAEIDALIDSKERQVELLREYRKSIISEAVTGKFKVPGLE